MSETKYYAHTKHDPHGMPLPQGDWQPLKDPQQFRRNRRRFPDDFAFTLTAQGRGKLDHYCLHPLPVKDIFLYPLIRNFHLELRAP